MMREALAALLLMLVGTVAVASAGALPPAVSLTDVAHTLDGSTLVITGWVRNQSTRPVSRLVVDASGFAPSGDLVAFGSDGIPWNISPDRAERFSVALPVPDRLIRDYTVVISSAQDPIHPLAGLRRSVDVVLYRPLVVSRVRVSGDVQVGQLTLRSDVRGMPVAQLTVEATLIFVQPRVNLLQTLTVTLLPDASEVFEIGGKRAALVSLRIVDLLLNATWD